MITHLVRRLVRDARAFATHSPRVDRSWAKLGSSVANDMSRAFNFYSYLYRSLSPSLAINMHIRIHHIYETRLDIPVLLANTYIYVSRKIALNKAQKSTKCDSRYMFITANGSFEHAKRYQYKNREKIMLNALRARTRTLFAPLIATGDA